MGLIDMVRVKKIKAENEQLKQTISVLNDKLISLGADDIITAKNKLTEINDEISSNNEIISQLREEISLLTEQTEKLNTQVCSQQKKLSKQKDFYKRVEYSITKYLDKDPSFQSFLIPEDEANELVSLCPTINLKLHCMDVKSLRKAYRENDKQIDKLLDQYSSRYTTKANRSIYQLMVIALRAELQNILYNLSYEKLDKSIEEVKKMTAKYLAIAGTGNQSIVGTLTKFIGEVEYLFINAVKIEYNYYVKKEQAKQEQLAIRQQMREEAEERKILEQQRKQIEKEEEKYSSEINKLNESLSTTTDVSELEKLKARILELQGMLSDVVLKKDEIANLQNGKAGYVYIISNLGSFGDNIFKIGMTRRLDPQQRIDELGSASVPFKFDVHSFIFSDDAVKLENDLHSILNNSRVNKVNLRKEFFYTSIDELESIVTNIDSTAEFNRTMLANEFRQSLSSDENYESLEDNYDDDNDE